LSEANKRKLLKHFVLGVPAYRLRFRLKTFGCPVSLEATERFFLLIRQTMALLEECTGPLEGSVECGESAFGGKRKGKRSWGAEVGVLPVRLWFLVCSSATAWCACLLWITGAKRHCCHGSKHIRLRVVFTTRTTTKLMPV
jgi:hypothetical protein